MIVFTYYLLALCPRIESLVGGVRIAPLGYPIQMGIQSQHTGIRFEKQRESRLEEDTQGVSILCQVWNSFLVIS
jgi:hypothetical protein